MASNQERARTLSRIADALVYASIIVTFVTAGFLVITNNGYWGAGFLFAGVLFIAGLVVGSAAFKLHERAVEERLRGRLDG